MEHTESYLRRVAIEETDFLAQALILATTEPSRIMATREHIWALQEYYESTLEAMRQTIKEQHQVIHEVASR